MYDTEHENGVLICRIHRTPISKKHGRFFCLKCQRNDEKWALEIFCQQVKKLKDDGMSEEDAAKKVTKKVMNDAVDIVTGKKSLIDVLKS